MIRLSMLDLMAVYGLFLLTLALVRLLDKRELKSILGASVRMVIQLLLVGYVLKLIFAFDRPGPVVAVLAVMAATAVWTIAGRVKRRMPGFYRVVSLALLTGCGGATLFFCFLVVGVSPWYLPRYLIPLSGMIIGNSMTGAILAADRLTENLEGRRDEIETSLALGASSFQAVQPMLASALRAAMTPTVNSMAAMGIVFLPGMMTGQVLSGIDPMTAVTYQIAIMCVITASVTVASFLILWQGYRGYFTPDHQLRRGLLKQTSTE